MAVPSVSPQIDIRCYSVMVRVRVSLIDNATLTLSLTIEFSGYYEFVDAMPDSSIMNPRANMFHLDKFFAECYQECFTKCLLKVHHVPLHSIQNNRMLSPARVPRFGLEADWNTAVPDGDWPHTCVGCRQSKASARFGPKNKFSTMRTSPDFSKMAQRSDNFKTVE